MIRLEEAVTFAPSGGGGDARSSEVRRSSENVSANRFCFAFLVDFDLVHKLGSENEELPIKKYTMIGR